MSQWAIDGVGRSRDIFKSMKNAVSRRVQINLLYNNHNDADRSQGYSPYELKKKAKRKGQVCFYSIFIQDIDVADGVLGGQTPLRSEIWADPPPWNFSLQLTP